MDLFSNFFNQEPQTIYLLIIFLWSIVWKGIALWRAAGEKQKNWFIAILVINTVGLLEIIYLFKFAKRKLSFEEIKSWIIKKPQVSSQTRLPS